MSESEALTATAVHPEAVRVPLWRRLVRTPWGSSPS